MDIAASIQTVTDDVMLRAAQHLYNITGRRNLCMAGGVALNCVANGRLLREGPFDEIWIQPAAGDAGGSLGVALFVWYQLLENARVADPLDSQEGSLLGPRFEGAEIRQTLDEAGAAYAVVEDDDRLYELVSDLLASGNVVAWCQGRMEFGPRALGARSILGDARDPNMQSVMNRKIKFRESFRPFAPAVLIEHVDDWFERSGSEESPYMLLVSPVAKNRRVGSEAELGAARGLDKLALTRSEIPAVTHVDYSARLQTVDRRRNRRFHALLERFYAKTACPVIINTSFNVRGEPIVCTAADAYRCFMATNIDALVIDNFVLLKDQQAEAPQVDVSAYLREFALD